MLIVDAKLIQNHSIMDIIYILFFRTFYKIKFYILPDSIINFLYLYYAISILSLSMSDSIFFKSLYFDTCPL